MRRRLLLLFLGACAGAAPAAVYKYIDPVTRIASYSNFRLPGQPSRELTPPPSSARRHSGKFKGDGKDAPARLLGMADFPRIDPARQRQMDADRKVIIGDELRAEETGLRQALAAHAPAESLHRRQADVDALRRELGRLK
jgi:hypothetical protein